MAHLRGEDVAQLNGIFKELVHEVTLHLATDELEYRLLMEEIVATSGGKVKLVKLTPGDAADDAEIARLRIARTPGMALTSQLGKGTLGFYGHPMGYEMATLIAAIVDLGGAGHDDEHPLISPSAQQQLDALTQDLRLQVFSTPG